MWPHRWRPTRLPHPWDSPGKNTGVGCHFLLQCMKVKSEREVAQSCPTLSNPMDRSLLGPLSMGFSRQEYWSGNAIAFSDLALSSVQFSSVQFSRSVVSDSLRPHESQHPRPPLPGSCPGWSRVFEAGTASATYLFKYFIKDIKSNRMRIAQ